MSLQESETSASRPPIVGRTVWDIAVASSYVLGGVLFLFVLAIFIYFAMDGIPTWFWISIAGSSAFIPFLIDRAKEDADLFMVTEGAMNLTEYRVGRRYGLNIEGQGVLFVSNSGTYRTLLTGFDAENRTAYGSSFSGLTQIDQIRDMNTIVSLSNLLEETLREQRLNSQVVGVEVEKEAKKIVDWALKTVYGSIIPTEISEIFGVDEDKETTYDHVPLEEFEGEYYE